MDISINSNNVYGPFNNGYGFGMSGWPNGN